MFNKRLSLKYFSYLPAKFSLRTILIVPFILQILAVVGLTGYLAFKNGQQAVNEVAAQLLSEISRRVEQNLQTFLEMPHQINQNNSNAIKLGQLDVQKFAILERHLFEQLQVFHQVSLIGFANTNNEFISAEKFPPDDLMTIRASGKSTKYNLRTYTTNFQGDRTEIKDFGKPYTPQRRDWYNKPIKEKKQIWSEIYPHNSGVALYIGASQPVYDQQGNLQGILLSNLNLSKIGAFLNRLKIGETDISYIIERSSERLVATSTNEKPFRSNRLQTQLAENKIKPFFAIDSSNKITKAVSQKLQKKFGNLKSIETEQQLDFKIDSKRHFIQVLPFADHRGIDWLIVVVVPEDHFMAKINANTRATILLCIVALIVAVVIGILILHWITEPVLILKKSALALAQGEWEKRIEIKRSDELGELAKSFNSMADQLQAKFVEMQDLNKALSQNETRLKQFLDAIPVSVSINDPSGQTYYTNRASQQLVNVEILPFVENEQMAKYYQIYLAGTDQLYPTDKLPTLYSFAGETVHIDNIEFRHPNKTIPVEVLSTPIFDESGKVIYALTVCIDVTERKKAEKILADYNSILERQVAERTLELQREIVERKQAEIALLESETRFRLLAEATFEAITITERGILLYSNQTCAEMFGYELSELVGMCVMDFTAPECREQVTQKMLSGYEGIYETVCLRKDGTTFPAEVRARVMSYRGRIIRMAAIQDITSRKQAEQATVLAERNRLAQEIHDTLAQAFAVVIVHLDTASRKLTTDIEVAQTLIKAGRDLAHSGLTEARCSIKALRSQLLEDGDIFNALNRFATQIFSPTNTHIVCQVIGEIYPLSPDIENNLLRIGQEALTNAFKYAQAGEIQIKLAYQESQCSLRIKDDGQGFDMSSVSIINSFGLLVMSERAERIGAKLTIQSSPGQGTEVVAIIKISL
ncbi:PAS domain S-box protein [Nostocaceae cyanobacterium CENA357]|uniref:histidine kinase n=1 Tax=Atlanticothrix silvestris CENA357 TaxID=1725252 RepID=A0A8J7HN57_9CYAN|nr:PAS domain S-box protein [Atlanticothrix silvestris]MBH8555903.1 PAS domain S-box protein [Atlanticothrix silvestris CENA357]